MSSSNDQSFLNTGLSSAVSRRQEEQRKARLAKKELDKAVLNPSIDRIYALIDKERKEMCDVTTFVVGAESLPEDIKSQMIARQYHVAFLDKFKSSVQVAFETKRKKHE